MNSSDIEATYERLAQAIDRAGPAQAEVFLAKCCLLLAQALDEPGRVEAIIEEALHDLPPERARMR